MGKFEGFVRGKIEPKLHELLDSRHVYKSSLFEHLYVVGVLELFGYHIGLQKDAWQMNV